MNIGKRKLIDQGDHGSKTWSRKINGTEYQFHEVHEHGSRLSDGHHVCNHEYTVYKWVASDAGKMVWNYDAVSDEDFAKATSGEIPIKEEWLKPYEGLYPIKEFSWEEDFDA